MKATGIVRRAETVVGMETPLMPHMAAGGARSGSAAMEIMQLDNGATAKSTNGNFRRQYNAEYRFIAENGTVETDVYQFGSIRLYKADAARRGYVERSITPPYVFDKIPVYSYKALDSLPLFEMADVYMINTFIQSFLENDCARKYMIDVYQALDMSTVGTLAYRSILDGSNAVKIPNLRIKAERALWKDDNKSTDPSLSSGEDLLPSCKSGFVEVDDRVYQQLEAQFINTPLTTGSH